MDKKISYKDAGVDINAADKFVQSLKTIVKPTFRHEVLTGIGGFGSLFALNTQKYKEPVLVSSTDGVGTKLKLAFMMNRHDTVGIDLVAMCVNDIIVMGAEPLFMLDYIATENINNSVLAELVSGMVAGCREADCALVGGETAEMPDFYKKGEYDLAGFVVGVVEKEKIIDGSSIKVGDKIIGIASSGIHSNGRSNWKPHPMFYERGEGSRVWDADGNEYAGYVFPRQVHYLGRWIRHGEWYPDVKLRLFRRELGRAEGREPHDHIVVRGRVRRLVHPIHHFTYDDLRDHVETMNRFSSITAREQFREGRRFHWPDFLFRPFWRFLKAYVFKRGFLDGRRGLLIASVSAFGVMVKFAKLWELEVAEAADGTASGDPGRDGAADQSD